MSKGESAARIEMRKKTFARWTDVHLSVLGGPRRFHPENLVSELNDGVTLILLLRILTGHKIRDADTWKSSEDERIANVGAALAFLATRNVDLTGIQSAELKDPHVSLELLWRLIKHYSIVLDNGTPAHQNSLTHRIGDFMSKFLPLETEDHKIQSELEHWLKDRLKPVAISDFDHCWTDGKIIYRLVCALDSKILDESAFNSMTPLERATSALEIASTKFYVPQLLDAGDLISPDLDKISLMTYLSYLKNFDRCGFIDAAASRVSGPVLANGPPLDNPAQIRIELRNSKNEPVHLMAPLLNVVSIKIVFQNKYLMPLHVTPMGNGVFVISHGLQHVGKYETSIGLKQRKSVQMPGSPWVVDVKSPEFNAWDYIRDIKYEYAADGLENASLGKLSMFKVSVGGNVLGRLINAKLRLPTGDTEPVQITNNLDGTFNGFFVPKMTGFTSLTVFVKDEQIASDDAEFPGSGDLSGIDRISAFVEAEPRLALAIVRSIDTTTLCSFLQTSHRIRGALKPILQQEYVKITSEHWFQPISVQYSHLLSRCGENLTFCTTLRDLILFNMETQEQKLVHQTQKTEEEFIDSELSPDSKMIAFAIKTPGPPEKKAPEPEYDPQAPPKPFVDRSSIEVRVKHLISGEDLFSIVHAEPAYGVTESVNLAFYEDTLIYTFGPELVRAVDLKTQKFFDFDCFPSKSWAPERGGMSVSGNKMILWNPNGTFYLYDLAARQMIITLETQFPGASFKFNEQSVFCVYGGLVRQYSIATGNVEHEYYGDFGGSLRVGLHENQMIVFRGQYIDFWNVSGHKLIRTVDTILDREPRALFFDGKTCVAIGQEFPGKPHKSSRVVLVNKSVAEYFAE